MVDGRIHLYRSIQLLQAGPLDRSSASGRAEESDSMSSGFRFNPCQSTEWMVDDNRHSTRNPAVTSVNACLQQLLQVA